MVDVDRRLARVLAHPLRQRLLFEYGSPVSPSEVATALGERLNLVAYHTGVLLRAGLLELVRTERRRGAEQHFYRARDMAEIEDAEWAGLPLVQRRALARRLLEHIWREAYDALPRGGMDHATTHLSRELVTLDEQGRAELAAVLRHTADAVAAIHRDSQTRGRRDAQRWEVAMLAFARSRP